MAHKGSGDDIMKFSKKVNFGKEAMTNRELLEDHLREMREHLIAKKAEREQKLKADNEWLE